MNIREQVYRHLRELMRDGQIAFEDRLVDHEIAARLAVSRMPVREALLQLKNEGLLEGTSRGFRLRPFTPTDVSQLFEVRLLLEPSAARSACEKPCLQGLAKMQQASQAAQQAHDADDAPAVAAARALQDQLARLNPDDLSPREALEALYRLHRHAVDAGD